MIAFAGRNFLSVRVPLLLCLMLALSVPSFANLNQSEAELKAVAEQLLKLQNQLTQTEQAASKEEQALRTVEKELGAVQRRVSELSTELTAQQSRLQQLNEQALQLEQKLTAKQDEINAILRLAYKQSHQPLIKLLLSGERPENLARHLYYFSRLTEAQQTLLSQWLQDQQRLAQTVSAQQQTLSDIEQAQQALAAEQRELTAQKNRRAQVVAELSQKTRSTQQQLQQTQQEHERLTQLVTQLKEELARLDRSSAAETNVAAAKGTLPWPVEGKRLNSYGRSINGSALTWQGWLIETPEGTPVRAVHAGRILFADFFKSNGLLIIVDHGDGIWTLYGRNQTLLRDVGSWVNAGDVIAQAGRSGGYSESGLYFEVRKDGVPQNPASWLQ